MTGKGKELSSNVHGKRYKARSKLASGWRGK